MLTYVKAGTIKRVHVDRRVIAQNRKDGGRRPAITVQTSKGPLKARKVSVLGYGDMVMAGEKGARPQLSCGARVWFETTAAVEVMT